MNSSNTNRLGVPKDLFDIVDGHEGKKEILMDIITAEKPKHALLLGVPGTAKSLILEEIGRIEGSRWITGSKSSKAGILNEVLFLRPDILLIDEIDKLSGTDQASLLDLLENGKIVETKYERRRQIDLDTRVFASANRTKGMSVEFISRFKPFILHFHEYGNEEFLKVATTVMIKREGLDKTLASYIAERTLNGLKEKDIRSAIGLARICKTRKDVDRKVKILLENSYPALVQQRPTPTRRNPPTKREEEEGKIVKDPRAFNPNSIG